MATDDDDNDDDDNDDDDVDDDDDEASAIQNVMRVVPVQTGSGDQHHKLRSVAGRTMTQAEKHRVVEAPHRVAELVHDVQEADFELLG